MTASAGVSMLHFPPVVADLFFFKYEIVISKSNDFLI